MKPSLFNLPKPARCCLLTALYATELAASLWLAYELRFDFSVPPEAQHERLVVLLWLIPMQIFLLGLFHQLTPLLGYFSIPDLARIFHALFLCSVGTGIAWLSFGSGIAPPRGVIVMDFVFGLVGLTGVRLSLRTLRESNSSLGDRDSGRERRVAIIGAGDAGAVLALELSLKPRFGLLPVAFYDDDKRRWHSRVHDIPVLGPPEKLLESSARLGITEAVIAMPSASAKRISEIVRMARQVGVHCKTVPSLAQLALGQVRINQLRNVEVQDLLGQEQVELETGNIRTALQNRVVMVAGAGGSIGGELSRQIAGYHPRMLLLVDRSEPGLFQIQQELASSGHGGRLTALVADILDRPRLEQIFATHRPEIVFHAAAYKHIPIMEDQPGEALKNNTFGTAQLAETALEFKVERFILASTLDVINPTSVIGATKRLAEMYIQALDSERPNQTRFISVRLGNILGTTGSVVPVFHRQIEEGGPVTVTHPDMTRYFMTLPDAAMLVLQSAVQGSGGEIFVLDAGEPVKIADLARQMIELSGLKPDVDIQIEFTGVRPGEKLFEKFSPAGENYSPTINSKIYRFNCQPPSLDEIRAGFQKLRGNLYGAGPDDFKRLLQEIIPEYAPYLDSPDPGFPSEVPPKEIPRLDGPGFPA